MATIRGNRRKNRLKGTPKPDLLLGESGNDNLFGLASRDRLIGGAGNDTLDGGKGGDQLLGGAGDDLYVVDDRGDRVIEKGNQGRDTVRASISYTLPTAVETLEITGSQALNGTGNDLNNDLIGNDANNKLLGGGGIDGLIGQGGDDILDGGVGADGLFGGAGNDVYIVDDQQDSVSEKAITSEIQLLSLQTAAQIASLPDAGGTDLIRSTITYGLPNDSRLNGNVENLELLGTSNIDGAGNALSNQITGNSGKNTLAGADGNDVLNGGAGDDILAGDDTSNGLMGDGDDSLDGGSGNDTLSGNGGNDALRSGGGSDSLAGNAGFDGFFFGTGATFSAADLGFSLINDFTRGEDLIVLAKRTFGLSSAAGDSLTGAGDFGVVSTDFLADSSPALIVFSTSSSALYYNPNRTASGFGIPIETAAFALVAGITNLTALEFLVT